jgi:hypothetical protein
MAVEGFPTLEELDCVDTVLALVETVSFVEDVALDDDAI